MASSVLIQTFTCHWMDCSFKAASRKDMVEHTEAHLERYLPIKRRDYAAWRIARVGVIASATDDSIQNTSQPPDLHTPATPTRSGSSSPPGLPSDSNAVGVADKTRPTSPGAISQIAFSPIMSPPPNDKYMPSPSTGKSQRSFAALNAVSDSSPQLDQDLFTSPSPGTLWSGIGRMDIGSPSRNGVTSTSNALRSGAYTGRLPLVIPKSPSPTNVFIPKKLVKGESMSYSDRIDPESVRDSDGIEHRFTLGANTDAPATVAGNDHAPDCNQVPTFIFGSATPRTRTRSRSRTPNPQSIPIKGFTRPPPRTPTPTPPLTPGAQRKRPRSRSRSVLTPSTPLGPLRPLKPPRASASAASSVPGSTSTSVSKAHVETILEEKEACMDVDIDELNHQRGAGRPNDLLLPSGSGGGVSPRSPSPTLASEAENTDSAIISPSDHVDSVADNAGASSQPDWMYMNTQAPHSSLSDL